MAAIQPPCSQVEQALAAATALGTTYTPTAESIAADFRDMFDVKNAQIAKDAKEIQEMKAELMELIGNTQQVAEVVMQALQAGIRHIETAEANQNEEAVRGRRRYIASWPRDIHPKPGALNPEP